MEYANDRHGRGGFPSSWGVPPYDTQERRAWIRKNVLRIERDPQRVLRKLWQNCPY